jgi:starch-binding outer membrane protein SusE/F
MKELMKRTYIKILIGAFIGIAVSACSEEELVKLNSDASLSASTSASSVVLTKEAEGTDALTVSWETPDFGFAASPTYLLYIDKEGGDFSEAISVNLGKNTSKTFKVEELNNHLTNLEFEPGEASGLQFMVEAMLTTERSVVSAPVSVEATAYSSFLDLSTPWGVVGDGYNEWGQFPDAPFFTTTAPNVLVAYVKLKDGKIKFRQNNSWDVNLGDNGADGTLEAGGSDITVTAGHKKITFNPVANTYSIEPFTWGIVGSAYNDWGAAGPDFPFTYDDATDQWRAVVKLQTGAFKIRKNNDWGTNYGDNGADGTLELGGADLNVTAGKYMITFSEKSSTIEIVSIPNIWGLVGSAYNDWGNAGPDAQFDMDWRNEGVWILRNVKLLDGAYKFRDSNDWGLNYGDNNSDLTLETGGADITATAGYYTITLNFSDPNNPTWSKVKHN